MEGIEVVGRGVGEIYREEVGCIMENFDSSRDG
jgi:hypothetical protein